MAVRKNAPRPMGKRISAGAPQMGKRIGAGLNAPLAGTRIPVGRTSHSRPNAARPSSYRPPRPGVPRPPRPHPGYSRPDNGSLLGSLLTVGAQYLIGEKVEDTVSTTLGRIFGGEEETAAQTASDESKNTAEAHTDLSELPSNCSHCGAPVSAAVCEYCRCNVAE